MSRQESTSQKPRRRRFVFRLLAILIAISPVLGLELLLRATGLPKRRIASDPYVDLGNLEPLFDRNDSGDRMEIGIQRMHLFKPAGFPAEKQADVFRVFALGGSTTQGEPYSTQSAFPKWIEFYLSAMMPDKQIEVVNCGGLSYASYRVRFIADEILSYEPDLVLLYTGHNEYLEERSYQDWQSRSTVERAADWVLSRSKLCQAVRGVYAGPAERSSNDADSRTRLPAEVDALLDYRNGLDNYRRDDDWQATVPGHFGWNVERILAACAMRDVPIFAILPVCNLADCPPMKFELSASLSPQQATAFEQSWKTAIELQSTDPGEAKLQLSKALEIDSEHAGALYLMGTLALLEGDVSEARRLLTLARDHDVCKLRAPTELRRLYRRACEEQEIPYLDAQEFFEGLSREPVLASRWLVDHIHPSVAGHRRLALAIAEELSNEKMFEVDGDWRERGDELCEQHQRTLGEDYYWRGQQRLEGLLLWTQGRAKKISPEG